VRERTEWRSDLRLRAFPPAEKHWRHSPFQDTIAANVFRTARLITDIDTVVWDNGADMSPDFLYEIGEPRDDAPACKVAEEQAAYARHDNEGR